MLYCGLTRTIPVSSPVYSHVVPETYIIYYWTALTADHCRHLVVNNNYKKKKNTTTTTTTNNIIAINIIIIGELSICNFHLPRYQWLNVGNFRLSTLIPVRLQRNFKNFFFARVELWFSKCYIPRLVTTNAQVEFKH